MLRIVEESSRSDTGRQRTANEDSFLASPPLFAVADGMGGAQAGEVASRIAAQAFEPLERGERSPEAFLRGVIQKANRQIHAVAEHDASRSGMGTTLTSALVEGDEVVLGHVGDSRAYRLRDGELKLLTSDHSLVEELRRQGRLTDEQVEDHPQRSIITRALGPEAEVEVDTMTYRARPGDVYLLCSDGLTTMLKEPRVAEILKSAPSLEEATRQLVDEANEAGGRDNITVVAFRLEEAAEPVTEPSDATLVGPTATEAGLSGEKLRAGADAQRRAEPGATAAPARRRSRLRLALKALVTLAVIAVLAGLAVFGAREVYFLGADEGGRLTLYRGLPYELPLDINLYSEVVSTPVRVASLPEDRRDDAVNHELRSRDDAIDLLDDLEVAAVTASQEAGQDQRGRDSGGGRSGQAGEGDGGRQGGAGRRAADEPG